MFDRLWLEPCAWSVPDARSWLARHLVDRSPSEAVDDSILCVSELADAVLHAATGFCVGVTDEGGPLHLDVLDGVPLGGRSLGPWQPNGVGGLAIVDALASRWGVVGHGDRGKTVWCEFDRLAR